MPLASRLRARHARLLIVGCGDVGLRVRRHLGAHWRVLALNREPARAAVLREQGITPLAGDLDMSATLKRLAALASRVLHLAPPPGQGARDTRTLALTRALRGHPQRAVYISTTGVYGDAGGAWVAETRATTPATDRARRRVDAEQVWRRWGRTQGVVASVLRVPGIYALDRPGGDPRERVQRGGPVLAPADDVYTNHIHADDLARACIAALMRGAPQRIYHVADASQRKMGAHFEAVAAALGLPPPPRLTLAQAQVQLTPTQLSFWQESRRLTTTRLTRELRVVWRYPDVLAALAAG